MKYRIQIRIRGFDTFIITVYGQDGAEIGEIEYRPEDFDGFVDLDSHTIDFLLSESGVPERTLQSGFEE